MRIGVQVVVAIHATTTFSRKSAIVRYYNFYGFLDLVLCDMVFIYSLVTDSTMFLCAVDKCEQVCYIDYNINLGLVYHEITTNSAGEG